MTRIPPSWVETEEEGGQGPALTVWHCTQERLKVGFILNLFSTVFNVQVSIHTHLLNG